MHPSEVDDYRVIDTDTHVIEPYDLWTSRVSTTRWGDLVPHVRFDEELGEDAWFFGDSRIARGASAASAGWHELPPDHPPRLDLADPATWDPARRLQKMDAAGIWAHVLYPNVAGFGAGRLLTVGDPELMLACVRAYNDFLAEWSDIDRRRFVPILALPMWDLDLCEAEIARGVGLGHKGVIMTSAPDHWGLPKLADPHWDPLWSVLQEAELSVNFHIAAGDLATVYESVYAGAGRRANYAGYGVQFGMANIGMFIQLINGGVCHRFPDLKFVSVESGVGWIPYALSHLDWMWLNGGVPSEHPEFDLLPSEYFKRQMFGCFWFETDTAKAAIEQLGADSFLYETDFPHGACMDPGPAPLALEPRDFIAKGLGDLPTDVLRKVLHDNAAALYHLD